jgi:D-sedoheptulose 7-phosphate isomerase
MGGRDGTIGLDAWLAEAEALLGATRRLALDARMDQAVRLTAAALGAGRPLLVCGNGGSAADAQHIVGEMVGRFLKERRALKAICLSSNPAVLTAWSNDYSYETVFSRQVEAYGEAGGVLLGLSTSGNSANVVRALEAAKALGMATIGLTGEGGGRMAALCDVLFAVPSRSTPAIQQVHLALYHCFCAAVEAEVCKAA